jgi:hypothetical protein
MEVMEVEEDGKATVEVTEVEKVVERMVEVGSDSDSAAPSLASSPAVEAQFRSLLASALHNVRELVAVEGADLQRLEELKRRQHSLEVDAQSAARVKALVENESVLFHRMEGERFLAQAYEKEWSDALARRIEAEQREIRSKVLKPLETEFAALELKIAEQEAAQTTLTAQLSSPDLANDSAKLREVTNAVDKLARALETSYSRWGALSEEIERIRTKLGITD